MDGCCDRVDITRKESVVTHDEHKFQVNISYCKNCGSLKATTHVKEIKC